MARVLQAYVSMNARRTFRRSVIAVATAFAAVPGCESGPEVSVNPPPPPTCEGDNAGVPGCLPVVECPVERPASGTACDSDETRCEYEPGDYCGPTEVICWDGIWQDVPSTCNPPAPAVCPEDAPNNGEACDKTLELCEYETDCDIPIEARCVDGSWDTPEVICNPPPPVCPDEVPTAGEPCGGFEAPVCTYGDCDGAPTTEAECTDGKWVVSEFTCDPPSRDPCPEELPEQDAACAYVGDSCGYGDCDGGPTTVADCRNGSWDLSKVSCNPSPAASE